MTEEGDVARATKQKLFPPVLSAEWPFPDSLEWWEKTSNNMSMEQSVHLSGAWAAAGQHLASGSGRKRRRSWRRDSCGMISIDCSAIHPLNFHGDFIN